MRKLTKVMWGAGLAAAGAFCTGFPVRVGLTRSWAQVSLPGDLVFPAATLQADRLQIIEDAGLADGLEPIWPYLSRLRASYEVLFDAPLELLCEETPDLMVWRTSRPARDGRRGLDLFSASLSVVLRPAGAGTAVHVRERYDLLGGFPARAAAAAVMTASAAVTTINLRRLSRRVVNSAA